MTAVIPVPLATVPARKLTEAQWCERLEKLMKLTGWTYVHSIPARVASGRIITPFRGRRGFPDYVLARAGVVMFREVKVKGNYPDPDQRHWRTELGTLARVWTFPTDWQLAVDELQHGPQV